MAWDQDEKHELTLDEGRENKAYKDQYGNWTIGVGHLLGNDPKFASEEWSDEKVDSTFETDFEAAVSQAEEAFPGFAGVDGPRKGVIVNMAFNMGLNRLKEFHQFFHYLDIGQYSKAADDLLSTLFAHQLPKRAGRLAYRIRTGLYASR